MNKNLESIFKQISDHYDSFVDNQPKTINERIDYINNQYNAINILQKFIAVTSNGVPIEQQAKIKQPNAENDKDNTKSVEKTTNNKTSKNINNALPKIEKNRNTTLKNKLFGTNNAPVDTVSINETNKENTALIDDLDINKKEENNNKDDNIDDTISLVDDIIDGNITLEDIFKEELLNWGISDNTFGYELILTIIKTCKSGMSYNEVIEILSEYTGKTKAVVSSALSRIAKTADFSKTKYNDYLKSLAKNNKEITKEIFIKEITDFCI